MKEVYEEVELYEVDRLLRGAYRRYKTVWEANRLTAFVVAQVNSKKKLKPQSLITFPWEADKIKEEIAKQMAGRTEGAAALGAGGNEMAKLF